MCTQHPCALLFFFVSLAAQGSGFYKLIWLIRHSYKVVVLVFLYAASNMLSYYALARVDASAYTVLLQVNAIVV